MAERRAGSHHRLVNALPQDISPLAQLLIGALIPVIADHLKVRRAEPITYTVSALVISVVGGIVVVGLTDGWSSVVSSESLDASARVFAVAAIVYHTYFARKASQGPLEG